MNRPARFWLAVAIALEALVTAVLVFGGRIPRGHDGLQYLSLQYWFLDSAATGGGIPAWMPFMTHGTVANWWFPIQASPLMAVLLALGPLVSWLPFLPLHHLALFADRLVLLTGVWLLARRHLETPIAAAFATIAACANAAWITQPWFGLHIFYAVPLVLELLHRGWETGRWRWILLAGNLFAAQTLGGLPYFLPVQAFVVALYAACALAFTPRHSLRAGAMRLVRGKPAAIAAAVLASALPVAAAYLLLKSGTDSIVDFAPGREAGGSVPLRVFLTYGGRPDSGWDSSFLGALLSGARTLDFDGYRGVLVIPLAAFAITMTGARLRAWIVGGLLLLAFLNGTVVSVVAWALFPGLRFYRHLGLASGFFSLWLCFVAGFGVDLLATRPAAESSHRDARLLAALLAITAALVPLAAKSWLATAFTQSAPLVARADWPLLAESLRNGAIASVAVALAALAMVLVASRRARPGLWGTAAVALVGLSALDAHGARLVSTLRQTMPLDGAQRDALAFQPPPWVPRRTDGAANERVTAFAPLFEKATREETLYGVVNWSMDSFVFRDSLGSAYRVDHWLEPFDDLVRTCGGEPIRGKNAVRGMHAYAAYAFPATACPADALAGVSEPGKLRLFADAQRLPTPEAIAAAIQRPDFDGSSLFVLDESADMTISVTTAGGASLASPVATVERFGANELAVAIPPSPARWLYYADAWHPGWTATVNGTPSPVLRANLAYKAVALEPDTANDVVFRFAAPRVQWIYRLFALEGALWIALTLWLLVRDVIRNRP